MTRASEPRAEVRCSASSQPWQTEATCPLSRAAHQMALTCCAHEFSSVALPGRRACCSVGCRPLGRASTRASSSARARSFSSTTCATVRSRRACKPAWRSRRGARRSRSAIAVPAWCFRSTRVEAYEAGFRMGAGTLECDVTFTKDLALVCRHSQNDLATTTDILLTPLAQTCVEPFTPAVLNDSGAVARPARAECRTSELTLAEFKSLRGKIDAFDPAAQTVEQFVMPQRAARPDLGAGARARHAAHARREHRAVSEPRRANDARAQGAECRAAVQRAHARPARPKAHR